MHMQSCDLPVINARALPAGKGGGRGRWGSTAWVEWVINSVPPPFRLTTGRVSPW